MRQPPLVATTRGAVVIFVALYVLQIFSPLRLNTDSGRFLSMAISAVDGHGFVANGQPDAFPEGYPLLLAGLIRSGLGSTLWINTFNILCVLGSVLLFHRILALRPAVDQPARMVLCLLPLASWVWIKHAAIPLSENPYLLLSMAALLLASHAHLAAAGCSWVWWLGALLLALATYRVRTVGITLVAAIGVVAIRPVTWYVATKKRRPAIAFAGALFLIAVLTLVWRWFQAAPAASPSSSYLAQARVGRENGWLPYLASSFGSHLRELGEMFLNLPASRFPSLGPLFSIAGAVGFSVFVVGIPRLARRFPVLAAYAGLYAALILVWPFYDPRFWMPLFPVMLLCGWLALENAISHAAMRGVLMVWVVAFVALGLGAQLLNVQISLAGPQFPLLYGDGTTRDTYRVAFGQIAASDASVIDERALRLLLRFEPRARGTQTAAP
jgi:hypothetical protein